MDALTKAFSLIEIGCWVFPAKLTEEGSKVPLTERGHLDASNDPEQIHAWFDGKTDVAVGVHAGRSGLVLLDRDIKRDDNGKVTKNGYDSLTDAWLIAPETFNYTSVRGEGQHDIYVAPNLTILNGRADYRGLLGVDRRGGSSWWLWAADEVPTSREAFAVAPEWLCDPAMEENLHSFQGTPEEWLDSLVQGEPNLLVRGALGRIPGDMVHDEMVGMQKNAIRLGAEGATGVPVLLEAIREAWMNRPEENHGTPKNQWAFKFEEALESGIRKYGEPEPLIENLPAFDVEALHGKFNTAILTGEPQDKQHFSKVLNRLIEADFTDDERASILWNSPATKDLAREWGIDFVYHRVEGAHKAPEPERENPQLEEKLEAVRDTGGWDGVALLTDSEREYVNARPSFPEAYTEVANQLGFANPEYTYSSAWAVASMAFAFRGFLPLSKTDKMGVNIWCINLGESGTGKTRAMKLQREVLKALFDGDNPDGSPYRMGGDNSAEGMHRHLVERDRKPTLIVQDEASQFFASIRDQKWMAKMADATADYFEGFVESTSKITAKDIAGKSALTSLSMYMLATPDRMLSLIDDGQFLSGFLARVNWSITPDPVEDDEFFKFHLEEGDDVEFDETPLEIKGLVADLVTAARLVGNTPKALSVTPEARKRLEEVHKLMYFRGKKHAKWNIIKPSVRRLADTAKKCAAIAAMYRGDTEIRLADALQGVKAVEFWYNGLLGIVDRVAEGEFQQLLNDMELFIMREKNPTEAKLQNTFKNRIKKDPRELVSALNFLVTSGRVNREEASGKMDRFVINGGVK